MTESENEKVVRKIFEAMNHHDLVSAIGKYYAEDFVMIGGSGTSRYDIEQIRRVMPDFFAAFSPRFQIERMVTHGDSVWVQW